MTITAVVLAGGTSRRFGTDKLVAPIGGHTLLDFVVGQLPAEWRVVVVGPQRQLSRDVIWAREDPPGAGPAAGWVAGVQEAARRGATQVVSLPGDVPYGAKAAVELIGWLNDSGTVPIRRPSAGLAAPSAPVSGPEAVLPSSSGVPTGACVGYDQTGQLQPLHVAVSGRALDQVCSWQAAAVAHAPAHRLIAELAPIRVVLPDHWLDDIDTPADQRRWRLSPEQEP